MAASVCSFSFSSSSDEKKPETDPAKTVKKPSGLDTKDLMNVSGKSADSGTITNDPKETANSADSDFISPNKSAKKARIPRMLIVFFVVGFLAHLGILLPLHTYHDFIIRTFFHGPSEFHIHSASLSAFSTTSWRSRQISADGNISLSAENILLREKIIYAFIEVSVSQNDTRLSSNFLVPFTQDPGNKSLLNVNFLANIDASSVADFVKPDDSVSVDVIIRGTVTSEKSKKWCKNFVASCKNVELQFLPGSEKAEMINQGPIKCQSQKIKRKIEEDI